MGGIRVGEENSTQIHIHYEDLGSGQPVVLIHGSRSVAARGKSRRSPCSTPATG
jgi:hypothetical protein